MNSSLQNNAAPRAVIFDMDGVIVMSERAHWESWRAAGTPRGVDITYPAFLSCFGRVNPDCVRILFGAQLSPAESEQIAEDKEAAFRDLIRRDVPLAPGLRPLLDALRAAAWRLAVGSSAPPENVDLVLDAGLLRPYFGAVIHSKLVQRGKPAPDVFLLAAARLGVPPASCVVIEDAPAGIQAAVAAGMFALGVATTHTEQQLLTAGAHRVLPTLADVTAPLLAAL